MRRMLASALGALALGWANGEASAQDKSQGPPRTVANGPAKSEPIPAPVQTVPPTNSYCGPNGCYSGDCYYDQACGDNYGGQRGSIIAGFGMYLIQPYFNTNPAYNTKLGVPPTTSHTEQHDFRQNWDVAPEAWLGYVGPNGFGARVRYFQYAQTSNFGVTVPDLGGNTLAASTANPLGLGAGPLQVFTGDQFNFTSRLGILVWDFEFLQTWNPGCWQVTGSAGVRYAHVSQNYGAQGKVSNPEVGPISFTLDSGHSFNGAGPTVALEGRRAFGGSGLALYANARGSLLFGSDYQRAFLKTSGFGTATLDAYQHESNVLPVAEAEIGAEFGRNIGPTRALLQVGFVGQAWFGAGNASNSQVVDSLTLSNTPNNSSNLGLAGMVIRAGISY